MKLMKYRRKPESVEAICYTDYNTGKEIVEWCKGFQHTKETLDGSLCNWLSIPSSGEYFFVSAQIGDYVLRYEDGSFEVWTHKAFKKMYEVSL